MTSNHVVSAALVIEREELGHQLMVQRPIYFVGEVLTDPKVRYPQVWKLLYAILMATRKPYTTSLTTKSQSSLHTRSETSSATTTPQDESPSGHLNSWAMISDIALAPLLSLRLLWILSPNGQRSSNRPRTSPTSTRQCTSMGRLWHSARGLEWF